MPRDPRDLSLIDGEYRIGQSETVSGEAGDQPGAIPIIRENPIVIMGRSLTGQSETIDTAARIAETW